MVRSRLIDNGLPTRLLAKVPFKDLSSNKFLSLTFRQPSDSVGFAPQTQTVKLLPVTRTTLEFRPSDTELFVGEEKVFELSSNNAKNIRVSPEWTRGLFVSFSGFTDVGLQAFTARKIILADGMDIYDALRRRLSIPDIIAAKIRHASEYREPFRRVRDLIPL